MDSNIIRAISLVAAYVESVNSNAITFDVKVVWYCKTLQNWKALLITSLEDKMYYEVTHNGDKKETYIDAYQKVENVCVPDYVGSWAE